jgi:hypothetical protein
MKENDRIKEHIQCDIRDRVSDNQYSFLFKKKTHRLKFNRNLSYSQ